LRGTNTLGREQRTEDHGAINGRTGNSCEFLLPSWPSRTSHSLGAARRQGGPEPRRSCLLRGQGRRPRVRVARPAGGLRGLVTVRSILGNIRVIVVPEQVAVGKAHEAFETDGRMKDAKQADSVRHVGARVAEVARALARV